MKWLVVYWLSTAIPSRPWSSKAATRAEMSRIVVAVVLPGATTFSRPSRSMISIRPSGVQATPDGAVRLGASVIS